MRKILLTTALVLPISGFAFAQSSDTTTMPETAAETVENAADAAGTAVEDAADATGEAVGDAAHSAEHAAEDVMDSAEGMAEDAAGDAEHAAGDAMDAADDMAHDAAGDVEHAAESAEAAVDGATELPEAAEAAALEAEMASSDKVAREQSGNELRIDWIAGASVTSPDGTDIGSVNDAILDAETGQMIAAIIGVGGFLGIGEKQIAVPWDQLTINYDAREITTELTKEEAEAAPEYVFREREDAPAPAPAPVPADPAAAPADPAAPAAEGEAAPAN